MTQRVSTGKKYKREKGPLNDFTCWNHFFQATLSLLWGYSLYITYPEVGITTTFIWESIQQFSSKMWELFMRSYECVHLQFAECRLFHLVVQHHRRRGKIAKKSSFRIFQLSIVSFCIWRECKEIISNF